MFESIGNPRVDTIIQYCVDWEVYNRSFARVLSLCRQNNIEGQLIELSVLLSKIENKRDILGALIIR